MDKMSGFKITFKKKKRRYFSETFKKEKVKQILTKKITIRELSLLYDIALKLIYEWIKKYSPEKEDNVKIIYEMKSEAQKTLFYKNQVADLERIIGSKQIKIDFLNQLIEVASQELDVDIKKKFSTKQLSGSEIIHQNETLQ